MMMSKAERIEAFQDIMEGICSKCFIDNLISSGFFDAPAGMKHHGTYAGALFDHSLQVAYELENLTEKLGLQWQRHRSPQVIGLLHDMCKSQQYVMKKDDETDTIQTLDGKPHEVVTSSTQSFEWNYNLNLPGHGDASLIRIMELQGPQLTPEEIYCIRYHMGAYAGEQEWKQMDKAVKQYPNILYTHLADMIASKLKGV